MDKNCDSNQLMTYAEQWEYFATHGRDETIPRVTVRPTDVYVVTPGKAGTTWVQQIVHQLRSGGDEEFPEIDVIVPMVPPVFLDYDNPAIRLDDDQAYQPRCFKSHDTYDWIPKGARYIYIVRDPVDTMYSTYCFFKKMLRVSPTDDTADIIDFFDSAIVHYKEAGMFNTWASLSSWLPHYRDENVLWLHYEDLHENRQKCVVEIAKFMGIDLTNELNELVLERSSFEYMASRGSQFDSGLLKPPLWPRSKNIKRIIMPRPKVRQGGGKMGQGKVKIPQECLTAMEELWEKEIRIPFGYKNYRDMRENLSLLRK